MKTYKGLRGILAALGMYLLATTAYAEPRLAITPLGLQITGRAGEDAALMAMAAWVWQNYAPAG